MIMKTPKPHAGQIELAVAMLFSYRVYTIVPNVSWGLGLRHECDMLLLDSKDRFTEVEIKVSASDLKADFKKGHGHKSKIISRLFYAMPIELCEKYKDIIPKECGIISVKPIYSQYGKKSETPLWKATFFRQAKHDKTKDKPSIVTIRKFMMLGCMRIWTLKSHNNKTRYKNELTKNNA